MYELVAPPSWITIAFCLLTALVVLADVVMVGRAAAPADRRRWTLTAAVVGVGWLALHAGIAESGVLEGDAFPPRPLPYLALNVVAALAIVFSSIGRRLRELPLILLIGLQSFRLPLEWLLHQLYEVGTLPVQMTWSGYNFDVLTAIGALAIVGVMVGGRRVPSAVLWMWNILGFALLLNVVTIALLSAPLPIRQFHNEPAVLLVFVAPFNWIVNVHVFTALVGHLIVFRALWSRRAEA